MCGITGFILSAEDRQQVGVNSNQSLRLLLRGIEPRGKDATGAAWWGVRGDDPCLFRHVRPVHASLFVQSLSMPKWTNLAIGHTRFATQGSPENNVNNHPIRAAVEGRTIIGIHNGVIYNDDRIFRDIDVPRAGEVDSEAIYALLIHKLSKGGSEAEAVRDTLEEIDGSYALAWLDTAHPGRLHLARGNQSPLVLLQTTGGSLFFGSLRHPLAETIGALGLSMAENVIGDVAEGVIVNVEPDADGRLLLDYDKFDPLPLYRRTWSTGTYGGTTSFASTSSFRGREDSGTWWKKETMAFHRAASAIKKWVQPQAIMDKIKKDPDTWLWSSFLEQGKDGDLIPYTPQTPGEMAEYESRWDLIADAMVSLYLQANEITPEESFEVLESETMDTLAELGAFVLPGARIRTKVGYTECDGFIVEIPQEFPDGWYHLLCKTGASYGADSQSPWVYVARKWGDFQVNTDDMSMAPEELAWGFNAYLRSIEGHDQQEEEE